MQLGEMGVTLHDLGSAAEGFLTISGLPVKLSGSFSFKEFHPMSIQRQFPKLGELRELLQFKKPELNATKRRLAQALTIEDLRLIAKRRTPKAAFDYTDGSAEGEISYRRPAGV